MVHASGEIEPGEVRLIHGDCKLVLDKLEDPRVIFMDPPDNIGLKYDGVNDDRPAEEYTQWLRGILAQCCRKAQTTWISFNTRWTLDLAFEAKHLVHCGFEWRQCIQGITFGQHNQRDFANDHRPLWRFRKPGTKTITDAIRVPSWRQLNGDKRADSRGRVPGDLFMVPRVTGNSKQRRPWHKTQLNEKLVEMCIKSSAAPGDLVIDPFDGTGTTARVCKRLGIDCTLIEISDAYVAKLSEELGVPGEVL